MAKRRKTSLKRTQIPIPPQSFRQVAERAVLSQSNKILAAATKRYKRFVRQAAKASNDKNKRKYLAAALSAVVIAGVVANDLKQRIDKQPARPARRKKRI
jgi:hypothetical protein